MAKCSNCGANVKNKSAFCPGCGTKMEQPVEVSGKKGISTVLVVVLVVLALTVGVGAGVIVAGMGAEKETSGEIVSGSTEETKAEEQEKESVEVADKETEIETETEPEIESEIETETEPEITVEEENEVTVSSGLDKYNYVYIGNEVREKEGIIYESYPEIYSHVIYSDHVEGLYEGDPEQMNTFNYSTIHFSKSQPRDVRVIDSRVDGNIIAWIQMKKYNDDFSISAREIPGEYLSADVCELEYGNVMKLSKDYLMTLDDGIYEFSVFQQGPKPIVYTLTVAVHDDIGEEVLNYRAIINNSAGFYSTESKNDVLFYMNGATSPIKDIILDNLLLDADDYELVCDGYGVVFHPEFLEKYKDRVYLKLLIRTESKLQNQVNIVFLNHVE